MARSPCATQNTLATWALAPPPLAALHRYAIGPALSSQLDGGVVP